MDDISDIKEFYQREAMNEDSRLERHRLEFDLTWRHFDQYLPPKGKILELGSATGRYTLELVRRGYWVTAVDISDAELAICRARLAERGWLDKVSLNTADARDLSGVKGADFDAVLIMGPLYHLVNETDRLRVLKEAFGRLKPGGFIFSAFISRFGILSDLIKKVPEWIEDRDEVRSIMETGKDPDPYPHGGFRGYFVRVSEIAPLHEQIGFETLLVSGVEPAIGTDDESYNILTGKRRELWLDLLYQVGPEQSIIGASRHLLYIGRKTDS